MYHLALYFFGPFQAAFDGRAVTGFRSEKARALLVYLAVEAGRPHSRESLAELLWPGRRDAGLTYLRHTLSNLNHLLDGCATGAATLPSPFLLGTRETIQLNPAADVWIDSAVFDRLLAGNPTIDALEQAVALSRGPFLEGFCLNDSPAFEEWLLAERERFDRRTLSALQRLGSCYLEQGLNTRAEECARRQLALDAWDEAAHRQLIAALTLDGRRNAALAQYEECARLLADELGVAPSRETTELYDRVRSGELHGVVQAATADLAQPAPVRQAAPFVARERELARLWRCLDAAHGGAGRTVFVTGDAGSGKSALLEEFGRQAVERWTDAVVAVGKCSAFGGRGDPYLPFREIFRMLAGDIEPRRAGGAITDEQARRLWAALPAAAQAMVEDAPNVIGRMVSAETLALSLDTLDARSLRTASGGWRAKLGEACRRQGADGEAPDALEPADLFAQVTDFLLKLARRHPLILLLDDLHWADAGSVSLLFHLGRRLADSRILVVGAYRPEDLAADSHGARHPLAAAVHELQRDCGDAGIDLNRADGQAFVDALLDSEPNRLDASFRRTFYQHTAGHALFTVELLHGLCASGDLVQSPDGEWVQGDRLDWESLPPRVEAVIAERLDRLPADWRALLEVASVEGAEFTAEVLARQSRLDDGWLVQVLSEQLGRRQRLVRAEALLRVGPQNRRLSRYCFTHWLYQKYLYHSLDAVKRAYLHEQVGEALEALYGTAAGEIAVQLAWHFDRAGAAEKAAHYRRLAGDRAMGLSAYEEAIAHYTRGLAQLATLPESPARAEQEAALQLALSAPLFFVRGWGHVEARDAIRRAYELCREEGARAHLFSALLSLSGAYVARGELQKSIELGEQLLHLAEQDHNRAFLAAGHMVIGEAQFLRSELESARAHLEQALTPAGAEQALSFPLRMGVDLEVGCLTWLLYVQWALGYPDLAVATTQVALARAHELGDPPSLAFALCNGGAGAHVLRREPETVRTYAARAVDLATEKGLRMYQVMALVLQGWEQAMHGQKAGIAQIEQNAAAWRAMGSVPGSVLHLALLADACHAAGETAQGLAAAEEGIALLESAGLRFFESELWRLKGELLLACGTSTAGASAEVEACFQAALAAAHKRGARTLELRAAVGLCRFWQERGRSGEALALLAPLYAWFTEGLDTPDLQAARSLLAHLECERAARLPSPVH